MDKAMRCLALLLFLLVVAPPCRLASPTPSQKASWHHFFRIKDKDVKDLKFWCEGPDAPNEGGMLEDYTLQPGQEVKSFFASIDYFYDCHFKWQSREKTVMVFDESMLSDCVGGYVKDCIWEARKDGFWFYDNKKHWIKKDHW